MRGVVFRVSAVVLTALAVIGTAPADAEDVCDFIADILRSGDARDLERRSPQTTVGEYTAKAPVPAGWTYPTATAFPELVHGLWSVSLVDLDNDGVQDVRFTQYAGTAGCETSYFFTPTADGGYRVLHVESGEAGICGDASMVVVAHRGTNVLVFYSTLDTEVYAVASNGTTKAMCRVQRTLGPSRLTAGCPHEVCVAVGERLQGWGGPDRPEIDAWEVSDRTVVSEVVEVGKLPITDADFRRAFRELQGRLINVDNDGRKEFVVMPWQGPRWGVVPCIFVERQGEFDWIDPRKRWPGWPERAEEGLLFVASRGKTYVVALTRPKGNELRGRLARIFLVDSEAAREIGSVGFAAEWVITIERDSRLRREQARGTWLTLWLVHRHAQRGGHLSIRHLGRYTPLSTTPDDAVPFDST